MLIAENLENIKNVKALPFRDKITINILMYFLGIILFLLDKCM